MRELRLQERRDNSTLSVEKGRIVWAVVLAGLILGTIYFAAKAYLISKETTETQVRTVK